MINHEGSFINEWSMMKLYSLMDDQWLIINGVQTIDEWYPRMIIIEQQNNDYSSLIIKWAEDCSPLIINFKKIWLLSNNMWSEEIYLVNLRLSK